MEEKQGWLETKRYVCRKCSSSMIIESSGIRYWECTRCHTVNYEENYLENKLKQELDKAREEGKLEVLEELLEWDTPLEPIGKFMRLQTKMVEMKRDLSKLTTK